MASKTKRTELIRKHKLSGKGTKRKAELRSKGTTRTAAELFEDAVPAPRT